MSGWGQRHPVLAHVRDGVSVAAAIGLLSWLAHRVLPESAQDAALTWVTERDAWPRGVLVLLVIAAIAWPILGVWALVRKHRGRPMPMPYASYRTDEFFGLRWRWKWAVSGEVIGPTPYCPSCDLQLLGQTQTVGIGDIPTGRVKYDCTVGCGKTHLSVAGANPQAVAHQAKLSAEREARRRGLLSE